MDDREKQHIFINLTALVDNTKWNTSCLSVPIEAGVFSDDDSALLESIPNRRMRILEFYRLFMTKENSYQKLIATLERRWAKWGGKHSSWLEPHTKHFSVGAANQLMLRQRI
ncbi:unnamed protein product [Orchesella dallaii]|uniref:Uncharacterized protein n=1 Tax=Orchesella dallaii TaxID=48710 RepID=A0ABP1RWX6_9HEXA